MNNEILVDHRCLLGANRVLRIGAGGGRLDRREVDHMTYITIMAGVSTVSAVLSVGGWVLLNRALKQWGVNIKSHVGELQRLLNEFEKLKAELEAAERAEVNK